MHHSPTHRGRSIRTSLTHPLRIDEVAAGANGGLIGVTFCPGKRGASHGSYEWQRDLSIDLDVVSAWRADAMATLIEDREFEMLGVPHFAEAIAARHLEWHHLPIVDVRPPDERFEKAWGTSGPRLRELLSEGGRVLVHCRGGLGRAGTVAARLLVELGEPPAQAVSRVRAARPGAIETERQLQYVLGILGKANS